MERELIYFNGINGESGEYTTPPLTGEEFARLIQGEPAAENLPELRNRSEQHMSAAFGIEAGIDPDDLSQAGWGIIFTADEEPQTIEALDPLLKHRQSQAGQYFRIYQGENGTRQDMGTSEFLGMHGAGPGPANPEKVPYYLLIVGSPAKIPFTFQTQLGVQYSVGRIYFETAQEYANYAASVVAAESGKVRLGRKSAFFGVANPDDEATYSSCHNLVTPLVETLQRKSPDWETAAYLESQASKAHLLELLSGSNAPALLFSACHGMTFPYSSTRQLPHQGALLCQEWPGPKAWQGPIPQDFYFSGEDLSSDANLLGMVAFFFACYGLGTPLWEPFFSSQTFKARPAVAPYPFLAQLPMRMLGLPRGGALAVVGPVERAWGYSFKWTKEGRQTEYFERALLELLSGKTIGRAVEYFNERYAELAISLNDELEEIVFGKQYDPYELAHLWTANNDARSYSILGDPVVRLPVVSPDEPPLERPEVIIVSASPKPEPEAVVEKAPEPETPATGGLEFVSGPQTPQESPEPVITEATAQAVEERSFPFFDKDATYQPKLADTMASLNRDFLDFTSRLMRLLNETVGESSSIEIETYQQDKLIATTRLHLDGDTQVTLHVQPEELDANLLALHSQMVQQARLGQAEMLKAMAAAVGSLVIPPPK